MLHARVCWHTHTITDLVPVPLQTRHWHVWVTCFGCLCLRWQRYHVTCAHLKQDIALRFVRPYWPVMYEFWSKESLLFGDWNSQNIWDHLFTFDPNVFFEMPVYMWHHCPWDLVLCQAAFLRNDWPSVQNTVSLLQGSLMWHSVVGCPEGTQCCIRFGNLGFSNSSHFTQNILWRHSRDWDRNPLVVPNILSKVMVHRAPAWCMMKTF